MTKLFNSKKKCSICKKKSTHEEVLSTSTLGSYDLDLRPPEMERSSMGWWIQTCPKCGFCFPDISERIKYSSRIVKSESYQKQFISNEFPDLANKFLCYSLIQEGAGDYFGAMWACLYAAWECDDYKNNKSAKKCREKAVIFIKRGQEEGQRIDEEVGFEEILLADLLRRSEQFEKALKICEEGLNMKTKGIIPQILQFQKKLIGELDIACHTCTEATAEE